MKSDQIIVSQKSIDKACDKVYEMDQKAFTKAVNRFLEEQGILSSIVAFVQEEINEDNFNEFVELTLIIWYAFKNQNHGKDIPEVSMELFEKVSSQNEDSYKSLAKALKIKDEDLLIKKLDEFNKIIENVKSEKDLEKIIAKMGPDFQKILETTIKISEQAHQPELHAFLNDALEIDPSSIEEIDAEKSGMLIQLMHFVQCFEEVLTSPFQLVATPGGKLIVEKKTAKAVEKEQVFQLKISLKGITPMIWRRVLVQDNLLLSDLHEVIQYAMGWGNCHLFEFNISGQLYMLQAEDSEFEDAIDPWEVRLHDVIKKEKQQFNYTYDFGDSWDHKIVVEKILVADPSEKYPLCLAGKRNCPPEDCGGIWGYEQMLEILADKKHPEHKEMKEWVGGKFYPEAFNLKNVNKELEAIFAD